jgi:hypothetical protein
VLRIRNRKHTKSNCLHWTSLNTCNKYLFVVYLTMLSVTQSIKHKTTGWQWTMNWKISGRKQSWSNLKHYLGIYLEWQRKIMKLSVRIAGVSTKIQIRYLHSTSHKCYHFSQRYVYTYNSKPHYGYHPGQTVSHHQLNVERDKSTILTPPSVAPS